MALRILLVNHTALVSGAERSLLELLRAATTAGVRPALACPEGPLAVRARALGVEVHPIRGTTGSLSLHPVRTPAAVAELVAMGVQVAALARRLRADVIHANSIRSALAVALSPTRVPLVAHVRDVLPAGAVSSAVLGIVVARATTVIAISRYVADRLPARARDKTVVIDNAVDVALLGADRDAAAARASLSLAVGGPVLAIVGQITPWKGQLDAIEVLALVRGTLPRAELLVAGETKFVAGATRHDNPAYLARLHARARELGVQSHVHFLGEREDIAAVLAASDMVLVPSWEEPFGRTVAEALAAGTPVLATAVGGPAEIIEDGRSGRLLAPRAPDVWAAAVLEAWASPETRAGWAGEGRRVARARFAPEAHARAVAEVYRGAIASRRGAAEA